MNGIGRAPHALLVLVHAPLSTFASRNISVVSVVPRQVLGGSGVNRTELVRGLPLILRDGISLAEALTAYPRKKYEPSRLKLDFTLSKRKNEEPNGC